MSNEGWTPVYVEENLAVMSIAFMLESPDEAVIWRGMVIAHLKMIQWFDMIYFFRTKEERPHQAVPEGCQLGRGIVFPQYYSIWYLTLLFD